MSIALQIKPFLIELAYYATSLDFGLFDVSHGVFISL